LSHAPSKLNSENNLIGQEYENKISQIKNLHADELMKVKAENDAILK
jgi:hypothetical protein